MTYQDLIEELQSYSPEELKQNVILFYGCAGIEDVQLDDENSLEDIDSLTCYKKNKIVLFV
jgi:hypothetical protein